MINLYKCELEIGKDAAEKAAIFIRQSFGAVHKIEEKGLGDLVSAVDREAEKIIIQHLSANFPKDGFIAEESGRSNIIGNNRVWIIDPLDATSAFLFKAGNDLPSIMIALQVDRGIVMGIVLFPLTKELVYAVKGEGAYYKEQRIKPVKSRPLSESWVDINQYSDEQYDSTQVRKLKDSLRKAGGARLVTSLVPHSGIAVRIALHQPEIDAVVHDNNPINIKQHVWDVAAPSLIVSESGGCVCNLKGDPYDPNHPEPFIIARDKSLAKDIYSLI